jgi:hypothetical protein
MSALSFDAGSDIMFGIVALLSLGIMGFGVIQKLKVVDHFG